MYHQTELYRTALFSGKHELSPTSQAGSHQSPAGQLRELRSIYDLSIHEAPEKMKTRKGHSNTLEYYHEFQFTCISMHIITPYLFSFFSSLVSGACHHAVRVHPFIYTPLFKVNAHRHRPSFPRGSYKRGVVIPAVLPLKESSTRHASPWGAKQEAMQVLSLRKQTCKKIYYYSVMVNNLLLEFKLHFSN
jgi:hypothetical protein